MSDTAASLAGADARRPPPGGDEALLAASRGGDERAFLMLTSRHHAALRGLAACWSGGTRTATRDIGRAWLAVLRDGDGEGEGEGEGEGDGAEGARSASREPLQARVARALVTAAGDRASEIPVATPRPSSGVGTERFFGASHELWPGEWADPPRPWGTVASRRLGEADVPRLLAGRVRELDVAARASVVLCDVHRWTPSECALALCCSVAEVRLSLRRGREALRALLEAEVDRA